MKAPQRNLPYFSVSGRKPGQSPGARPSSYITQQIHIHFFGQEEEKRGSSREEKRKRKGRKGEEEQCNYRVQLDTTPLLIEVESEITKREIDDKEGDE